MKQCLKALGAILILGGLTLGQVQAATISFVPQTTTVNVGDTFNVDIFASDFTELAGGIIDFSFDPASLALATDPLVDSYWDFAPAPGSLDTVDSGTWRGIGFDVFVNDALRGDGPIASLSFVALEAGASSLDILASSEFFSFTAQLFPTIESADITITAVPIPGAFLLFASGLLALVRLPRR